MTARAHIADKTKLASALLALGLIDYEHAKEMGRDNFISLFQFDHGILHAIEINDEFWNLTPRLIAPHREKSRKDTSIVAKVRRLTKEQEDFQRKVLARPCGEKRQPTGNFRSGRKIAAHVDPWGKRRRKA